MAPPRPSVPAPKKRITRKGIEDVPYESEETNRQVALQQQQNLALQGKGAGGKGAAPVTAVEWTDNRTYEFDQRYNHESKMYAEGGSGYYDAHGQWIEVEDAHAHSLAGGPHGYGMPAEGAEEIEMLGGQENDPVAIEMLYNHKFSSFREAVRDLPRLFEEAEARGVQQRASMLASGGRKSRASSFN